MARPVTSLAARIERMVAKQPGGCWLWLGKTDTCGYGRMKVGRRLVRAHRVAYESFVGAIPDSASVLHSCDVPACCFPGHLRVGTSAMNVADKVERNRQAKGTQLRAKLTEASVLGILADGRSHRVIADDYGVSHNIVGRIKRRQDWKHVEARIKPSFGRLKAAPKPTS